jgi:PTH2 family peptidyl-tRNA hydrolase
VALVNCEDEEMKQVILMRTDLGMSVGKMCAQAAHAVISQKEPVVVLKASSNSQLINKMQMARAFKLLVKEVIDAGRTEVPPGTRTCICIGPAEDKDIDKITGALPLL